MFFKTKYYRLNAYTPSEATYQEYVKIPGKTERECLDTAQEIAATFANDLAYREYIQCGNTFDYPSYEEFLNECGWSVTQITKAQYIEAVNPIEA